MVTTDRQLGGNIQNPSASQCDITEGEKGTHRGPRGPSRDAPVLVPWTHKTVEHSGFLRCHLYFIPRSFFFPIPESHFWTSFGKGGQVMWTRIRKEMAMELGWS